MKTPTELTDRELCLLRLRFLDLLISFFQEEPDAEKMSHWRGVFTALSHERITPLLDDAVLELTQLLETKSLAELQEEFYTRFTDPYSKLLLPLNASFYIDGKSYGPALVAYREFLKEAGIEKESSITEPEDSLPLMLDALHTLVEDEKNGDEQARQREDTLVQQFLSSTAQKVYHKISLSDSTPFFKQCIRFLAGYVELEQGLAAENSRDS